VASSEMQSGAEYNSALMMSDECMGPAEVLAQTERRIRSAHIHVYGEGSLHKPDAMLMFSKATKLDAPCRQNRLNRAKCFCF
jgi:hypothetical protein